VTDETKAAPRDVWVVIDAEGVPWTAWTVRDHASFDVQDGFSVARYVLATTLDAERERSLSQVTAEWAEAARVVAQACVVWAADTGDCHLCGEYERTARHWGDCPVNLYLASLETKSASPTPAAKPRDREGRERATADCLCREIDQSDRPCIVCVSSDELGILRPANAMPATERTGKWVLRYGNVRGKGGYWLGSCKASLDCTQQRHAQRFAYRPGPASSNWRPVALTRRVRRGP